MIDPTTWSAAELDWMRILFAAALVASPIAGVSIRSMRHPVGLARLVPLRAVVRHAKAIRSAYLVAAVVLASGRFDWVATAFLAAVHVIWATAQASSGSGGHARYLATIVLVAQVAADVADLVERSTGGDVTRLEHHQQTAWWSIQAIVALYFVSGVTKVAASGFRWSRTAAGMLIPVDLRNEERVARGEPPNRLFEFLVRHQRLAALVFTAGFAAEVLAPFGLVNRWTAFALGVVLVLLHQGSRMLLELPFWENQRIILVFLVNVPGTIAAI